MDLMTGWNFELKADRERAIRRIDEEEPMLVIGSPPCTYFSMLQELHKFNQRYNEEWLAKVNDNLIKATDHITCCITLHHDGQRKILAARTSMVGQVVADSRDGGTTQRPPSTGCICGSVPVWANGKDRDWE
jgi:hypothetical protein